MGQKPTEEEIFKMINEANSKNTGEIGKFYTERFPYRYIEF